MYIIMSDQLVRKNYITSEIQKDKLKLIVNVQTSNLSERGRSNVRTVPLRKIRSENQTCSYVNYDDLCGPWLYPQNPLYSTYVDPPCPSVCIWKYFTEEDLIYIKKYQENENAMHPFFEDKVSGSTIRGRNFFVKLLWESLKFARQHLFTEKSVSACLGIMYSTHSFFLSNPWWTVQEINRFFHKTVLLHIVSYPPRSLEVFTMPECKLMFKLFNKIYLANLILLHITCHPNYHFTLKLKSNPENSKQKE